MAEKVRSIEGHREDWENEEEYEETKENPFRQFPTSGSLGNWLWFLRLIRRISMLDEYFTFIYQDQKKRDKECLFDIHWYYEIFIFNDIKNKNNFHFINN